MNTTENEPKVELPKPPKGCRWEYRGMGFQKDDCTICFYWKGMGKPKIACTAAGEFNLHYWEAVPDTPFTSTGAKIEADYMAKLERENAELRQVIETTCTQLQSALDDLVRANDSRLPTSEKNV